MKCPECRSEIPVLPLITCELDGSVLCPKCGCTLAIESPPYKNNKVGTEKVMICRSTGKPVTMVFTGQPLEDGKDNGHVGWLCLHI